MNTAYRIQPLFLAVILLAASPLLAVPCQGIDAAAEIVKERIESFELEIRYNQGPAETDPPFLSLTLQVPKCDTMPGPGRLYRQIDRTAALELTDILNRDGFFDSSAKDERFFSGDGSPFGMYYKLILSVHDDERSFRCRAMLGWDLEMLGKLDGLREALKGEGAKAMDELLSKLEPYRQEWKNASSDPSLVERHARSVIGKIQALHEMPREDRKAEHQSWNWQRQPLTPLILPRLLSSADRNLQHEAMLLARGVYWNPGLVPQVIRVLDELLENPRDEEASTRMVACEVLRRYRDRKSIPVLLRALEDAYVHLGMAAAPGGYAEHSRHAVWLEADEALRAVTGLAPIERPAARLQTFLSDEAQRKVVAAWKKALHEDSESGE